MFRQRLMQRLLLLANVFQSTAQHLKHRGILQVGISLLPNPTSATKEPKGDLWRKARLREILRRRSRTAFRRLSRPCAITSWLQVGSSGPSAS